MPTYIFRIVVNNVSMVEEIYASTFLNAVKQLATDKPGVHIASFEGIAAPVIGQA